MADVHLYDNCRECKYYEILIDPDDGAFSDHACVIYPDCIYKEDSS